MTCQVTAPLDDVGETELEAPGPDGALASEPAPSRGQGAQGPTIWDQLGGNRRAAFTQILQLITVRVIQDIPRNRGNRRLVETPLMRVDRQGSGRNSDGTWNVAVQLNTAAVGGAFIGPDSIASAAVTDAAIARMSTTNNPTALRNALDTSVRQSRFNPQRERRPTPITIRVE